MKTEHLEERVNDYIKSIEIVIQKKIFWKQKTRTVLLKTLNNIVTQYNIGWQVQELNWIQSNEAINITFDSFPPELMEKTNLITSYQFIQGGSLVFSQSYSGDVHVIILFPIVEDTSIENSSIELGIFKPEEITEKMIIERVDEFLKQMIQWEVPNLKTKLGFQP
ncbi:conserved hypothetical protein [Flavobacterium sp. 9AF]|uniref:hypothetical protein n=1 Tax=Flavobacterium sp. 9AF TaxID=2653142 RepID=UPI0012F40EB6|nr:hypothetical protein [Flavobacterium sp. 9AF]VXB30972.1 conserved hypothetical protein [Flavobacterium sp. 9AF]